MSKKSSTSVKERRAQYQAEEQRRRRLYYGAAAIGAIAIIALFVILRQLTAPSLEDVIVPDPLEAPANADGRAWGPADALVLIEEYADYQCPFCGQFATGVGQQLAETYAASGQVRFEYNNFAFIGTESQKAAEAAECANEQGMFWQYHDTLFANQRGENVGAFSNAMLKNFAIAIGLDTDAFNSCFDSGRYASLVRGEKSEGEERGVNSTPTLFINGEQLSGGLTFEQYQQLINARLSQ
ncbi:MAG TPA: thioredoxin domain-containing protein [Chloroflexota bacterium]|nr:thioredoxin domain-containing protein [Chloroflexota bacterium]HUM72146.1 thioredoxin domain-containing protein [Chloroflexota bacterium]